MGKRKLRLVLSLVAKLALVHKSVANQPESANVMQVARYLEFQATLPLVVVALFVARKVERLSWRGTEV